MSRIPYPERSALTDAQRAYLDAPDRRMLNIGKMAMHTPEAMWKAQLDLATACVFNTTMDPRLREVLILRAAYIAGCQYELFHHRSISEALGFDDAKRAVIASGDFSSLAEDERVVAQFTSEVVSNVGPSDATLAAARKLFSDATIFEMVAIIGCYMMTARIIAVGGVEIDQVAVSSWSKEKAATA